MDALRNLYHGNLCFDSFIYASDSPYTQAVRNRQEARNELISQLTAEQKALFDMYEEASSDAADISRYDAFSAAFKFAINMMSECFIGSDSEVDDNAIG